MATRGKGSTFERWFCKRLSLWWTDGKRDDVFWRTAGSGGRATNRHRTGLSTAGGYGDIMAVDVVGQQFLDVFTLELKRGYSTAHVMDLVDKGKAPITKWEGFVQQAIASAKQAKSLSWMIVSQRDRRVPMCWFPSSTGLPLFGAGTLINLHYCHYATFVRQKNQRLNKMVSLIGCPLEEFWDTVTPYQVQRYHLCYFQKETV